MARILSWRAIWHKNKAVLLHLNFIENAATTHLGYYKQNNIYAQSDI